MLRARPGGVVIQSRRIITLNARGDWSRSTLLHKTTDEVPTDGVGSLWNQQVSHKLTHCGGSNLNARQNIAFLFSEPMDGIAFILMAGRELK